MVIEAALPGTEMRLAEGEYKIDRRSPSPTKHGDYWWARVRRASRRRPDAPPELVVVRATVCDQGAWDECGSDEGVEVIELVCEVSAPTPKG